VRRKECRKGQESVGDWGYDTVCLLRFFGGFL